MDNEGDIESVRLSGESVLSSLNLEKINVRALFSQGQSKLSVIMRCSLNWDLTVIIIILKKKKTKTKTKTTRPDQILHFVRKDQSSAPVPSHRLPQIKFRIKQNTNKKIDKRKKER